MRPRTTTEHGMKFEVTVTIDMWVCESYSTTMVTIYIIGTAFIKSWVTITLPVVLCRRFTSPIFTSFIGTLTSEVNDNYYL